MGPKLYRVTIFFGSHVSNFLEAPSSLVLLFSDLQRTPTCCSRAQDASPEFGLHSVLSTSGQRCVDLSLMENYNFWWGPDFVAYPLLCFRCFTTCKGSFRMIPLRKMPHQNIRLPDCLDSIPIEHSDFECAHGNLYFLMGPELYAVTIFFG